MDFIELSSQLHWDEFVMSSPPPPRNADSKWEWNFYDWMLGTCEGPQGEPAGESLWISTLTQQSPMWSVAVPNPGQPWLQSPGSQWGGSWWHQKILLIVTAWRVGGGAGGQRYRYILWKSQFGLHTREWFAPRGCSCRGRETSRRGQPAWLHVSVPLRAAFAFPALGVQVRTETQLCVSASVESLCISVRGCLLPCKTVKGGRWVSHWVPACLASMRT